MAEYPPVGSFESAFEAFKRDGYVRITSKDEAFAKAPDLFALCEFITKGAVYAITLNECTC